MIEDCVRRLVLCINRIDGKYYDLARENSAGENEVAVLCTLADGGVHSQKSICEEWLIPKTTINTVVHKMLGEGLVRVTNHSGKEKMLALTDEGKTYADRTLAGMRAAELSAMQKTLERFSPQFIDAMEAFAQYFIDYKEEKNGNR